MSQDWTEEFPGAITVTDETGVIVSMNRAAKETFSKDGGAGLVGRNVLDCHPEPSRSMVAGMLKSPRANTYTIEKKGVKKLIHQAPWYKAGRFAGLVEFSFIIPDKMAHHVRQEKKP